MLKNTNTTATAKRHALKIEPLTSAAFQPFGDVIEARRNRHHFLINNGFAERFHDLARIDVSALGGQPIISIF